jgi:transposase InsO family protein
MTHDGQALRILVLIDEYTRECLALRVARRLSNLQVIDTLADVMLVRGIPEHIRSDNGPEFIAKELRNWLGKVGTRTLYIEPGSPWENEYCESFNGKLRDGHGDLVAFDGDICHGATVLHLHIMSLGECANRVGIAVHCGCVRLADALRVRHGPPRDTQCRFPLSCANAVGGKREYCTTDDDESDEQGYCPIVCHRVSPNLDSQ